MNSVEKVKTVYLLCSLDLSGTTCYLKSLHSRGNWEIVADIEQATKCGNKKTAKLLRECYEEDMGYDAKWAIIPCEIEYRLINEVE
jgi:hypothetical protein